NPDAARDAVKWNKLAEQSFPDGQRPQWLARQRADLLKRAPGSAEPLPDSLRSDLDAYHEGLEEATACRYSQALRKLIPFTDRHPNHFMGWYVRGICHDGVGQLSDAAAAFTICAALKPDLPWPYFSRGLIRLQERRFQEAESDFTEALRLKPEWM